MTTELKEFLDSLKPAAEAEAAAFDASAASVFPTAFEESNNSGPAPVSSGAGMAGDGLPVPSPAAEIAPETQEPPPAVKLASELEKLPPEMLAQTLAIQTALASGDLTQLQELINPHLEKLQRLNGQKLDDDLTQAVQDGQITLEWAAETQKHRAQLQELQSAQTLKSQQEQEQQMQAQRSAIQATAAQFDTTLAATDPTYAQYKEIFGPTAHVAMTNFVQSNQRLPSVEETQALLQQSWTKFKSVLPQPQRPLQSIPALPENTRPDAGNKVDISTPDGLYQAFLLEMKGE